MKNAQILSIILGARRFLPIRIGCTKFGWIKLCSSRSICFHNISVRIAFNPPVVEPPQPPITAEITSKSPIKGGRLSISKNRITSSH